MKRFALLFALLFALPALGQHKNVSNVRVAYRDVPEKSFSVPSSAPLTIQQADIVDYVCMPTPANPPAGKVRIYCDSGTGNLTCINSVGANVCSGGGSSAAGPAGTGQISNGSGVLAPGGTLDDGTNFTVSREFIPLGADPYTDVRPYHVRAINPNVAPAVPGITATIANGSPSANLSLPSTFKNGDGIVIFGAGNACTLLTPSTPTVTPSLIVAGAGTGLTVPGPAGSSANGYAIVARDKAGCLTAASTTGTTSTAAASLGMQSVTVSGFTRSGATVTATTATPHGLAPGAWVEISTPNANGTDNLYFGGHYTVATTADNTHFTYLTGNDVADGAPTASGAGGTAYWGNVNHLSWPVVAGAFEYYIYGRTGGSLIYLGTSRVQSSGDFRTPDTTFDDFGSPSMDGAVAPYFVPSTPSGSPLADPLVTTIVAGAGTPTLTLANAASTSVSGATILFDNAPNIATAAASTQFGSLLYFPGSANAYVVNSYLTIPTSVSMNIAGANLLMNDTMEIQSSSKLLGMLGAQSGSSLSFGYPVGGFITAGRANPAVYGNNADILYLYGIQINAGSNGGVGFLCDNCSNGTFNYLNFSTTGTDVMTVPVIFRTPTFLTSFDHIADVVAQNGAFFGILPTPAFMYGGGLGGGDVVMSNMSFSGRGIFRWGTTVGPGINTVINGASRIQGGTQPFFTDYNAQCCESGSITFNNVELDTMPHALYVQLGAGSVHNIVSNFTFSPVLGFGVLTGLPAGGVTGIVSGQNNAAIAGPNFTNNAVNVTGNGEFMVPIINTAAPSLILSAGGSVTVGAHTYTISMVDINGNESFIGPGASITTTGGSQTVTVSPASTPVGAIQWIPYRDGARASCATFTFSVTFVDTGTTTCGQSVPAVNRAGSQSISAAGLTGTSINLVANGFKLTETTTLTANRVVTDPDASGVRVIDTFTQTLTNKTLTSPIINGIVTGTALQGTDTKLMSSGTVVGTGAALCTDALGGATTSGCPSSASFYQTVLANATPATQEPKLNLIAGANMTVACVDNGGATRTDCTLTSSSTGATAFSAITAATNSNAGSFVMSGNTLDLTAATLLSSGETVTNVVAPSAPAAGKNALYSDSTALRFHDKNASGVIGTTIVADTGASNNFLTAISAAGVISKAQPAFTNISGVITTAQEPTSTVNAITNDTNVTGSIAGQTLTLAWTGTLSKARSLTSVVYNDQSNAYTTGAQDFRNATSLDIPSGAGLAPTTSTLIGYDSTANKYVFGQNGATVSFGLSSSACALHTFVSTPATATATAICTQPAYTDLSGTLTAAQVTNAFDRSTNNALGAHFFDMTTITAPANPAASNGRVYIDSSTNQLSCLLSTGASCMPAGGGGGGANPALSNLTGVAINTSLLPATDNTIDLGSAPFRWRNIYFGGSLIGSGTGPVTLQGNVGACTGAASLGTLCFSSTGNRPVYDFNLGGFANLVLSGTDINTSDQVTATHLASPLPVAQGGTAVTDFSFSGSTHKACTTSGTLANGNVVKFDASGNCVDGLVIAANLNSNSSSFTAGDLVSAAATHSTQDSGIAVANVFTTTTKADKLDAGFFCADAGTSDTYACSLTPAITAYVTGTHYFFKANTANTAASGVSTINFNAVGAITIKKAVGGVTTDLVVNDIRAGQIVEIVYDGTNMQMESTLGNAAGSGTVTTTGSPAIGNLTKFSSGSAITNGDLSGDCTTSGTLAITCTKLNGTAFAGTNGDVVTFGAANIPADSGILGTNIVRKDAANTGAAAMTLDMSASTSAASLRVPNIAGASSATAGVLSYDTTNKGIHAGANSIDNTVGIFASTLVPVDGDCMVWKVTASVITLDDRGACPAGGSGTVSGGVSGDLGSFTSPTAITDSGIVAANVVTNSTNLVNGNLVNATGNHTVNDSGVVSANVATAASNAAAANQIWQAGGANKTLTAADLGQPLYAPAANNVNGVAGVAWDCTGATPAALLRAGTNNKVALLSPWGASDTCVIQFHIPGDADITTSLPTLMLELTSTDATNGHTIIMQESIECAKLDGSTTDDVAFNAARSFSTITLNGNANRTWQANITLNSTDLTGCSAPGIAWIKVSRTTDTATNVGVYGMTFQPFRRPVVQAN